jgi:transcriptional regulator with XRE-family HTH domain
MLPGGVYAASLMRLLTAGNSNANSQPMRLAHWLEKSGTTQDALAKAVGVTQGRISQLLAGGAPSMLLAAQIARATAGAVTANDFLPEVGSPKNRRRSRAAG